MTDTTPGAERPPNELTDTTMKALARVAEFTRHNGNAVIVQPTPTSWMMITITEDTDTDDRTRKTT